MDDIPQSSARLFVGQIPFEATEDDIRQIFSCYGRILHIKILHSHTNVVSSGTDTLNNTVEDAGMYSFSQKRIVNARCNAFVTYSNMEEADASIQALHGVYFMDREKPLQVTYCQSTEVLSKFGHEHAVKLHEENSANPLPLKKGRPTH